MSTAVFTGSGSFWQILNIRTQFLLEGRVFYPGKCFMIYLPTME